MADGPATGPAHRSRCEKIYLPVEKIAGYGIGKRTRSPRLPIAGGGPAVLVTGPLGLIAIPFVLIVVGFAKMSTESDEESTGPVNCPDCGAPNEPGSDACNHCGEAL